MMHRRDRSPWVLTQLKKTQKAQTAKARIQTQLRTKSTLACAATEMMMAACIGMHVTSVKTCRMTRTMTKTHASTALFTSRTALIQVVRTVLSRTMGGEFANTVSTANSVRESTPRGNSAQ